MLNVGDYCKHYKGGLYKVIGIYTAADQIVKVVYTDNHEYQKLTGFCQGSIVFQRPYFEWNEMVEVIGKSAEVPRLVMVPRFVRWDPVSMAEVEMKTDTQWKVDRLESDLKTARDRGMALAQQVIDITSRSYKKEGDDVVTQRPFTALSQLQEAAFKILREYEGLYTS